MSNARRTRGRGRRLALGFAILMLMAGFGWASVASAQPSEPASHASVVAAQAETGVSAEAGAATVVDVPAPDIPVIVAPRPVMAPVVDTFVRSADRLVTGERAPPRLTR
jgi:hypothetical protein